MCLLCIFFFLDCFVETTHEEHCIQFSSFFTQQLNNRLQNRLLNTKLFNVENFNVYK